MARVIPFPQERRRREPLYAEWSPLWAGLPVLPTPEQEYLIWNLSNRLAWAARALDCEPESTFHEFLTETGKVLAKAQADSEEFPLAWPPRNSGEWEILAGGLLKMFRAFERELAEKGKLPPAPPSLKVHVRKPHDALWAALWPRLRALPSRRQERFISALVEDISGLLAANGRQPLREPANWLLGLLKKLSPEAWPPADKAFWGKACKALKSRRDQLAGQARGRQQRTAEQNRKLWALVRERFAGDRTILDDLLRSHFPAAVRKAEGGSLIPSTRRLTKNEAHQLIEMLQNPAYVPPTHRKARA